MRVDINEEIKALPQPQSGRAVMAAAESSNDRSDGAGAIFENGALDNFIENENFGNKDKLEDKDSLDSKQKQQQLQSLANSMNEEYLAEIKDETESVEDEEVEAIVTVQEKIRMKLEAFCDDFNSGVLEEFSSEELACIAAMEGNAALWANKLKEADLPVTEFNIKNIQNAMTMISQVTQLTDGAKMYFVQNPSKQVTIEALYISSFSSNGSVQRNQSGNYYSTQAGGYVTRNSVGDEFGAVSEQIKNMLQKDGIEPTNEVMENAEWLYDRQLPINRNSLNRLAELQQLELPLDEQSVLEKITDAMKVGKLPTEANLTDAAMSDVVKKSLDIVETIRGISDEQLKLAIANASGDVTVADLMAAYDGEIPADSGVIISDSDLKYISAKRQLEEIRLQMTVESVAIMEKNGISVDTNNLSEMIDNLKLIENNLNARKLAAYNADVTTENVELLSKVNEAVEVISTSHARLVGVAAFKEEAMLLSELEEEGKNLTKDFKAVNDAYEAVMTKPRADMGDSINKAFRNVDDILDEMNIEKTIYNQRAVRILGYNNMEITEENINRVKEADVSLNQMLSHMKPSSVIKMIRDNFNPLSATISEINDKLNEYQEMAEIPQEKYSEFLWKMEHRHEISESEKEAYIGIYRLVNQIEKSDGALVGALISQGAELTMENLLSASRTRKHSSMDYKVDDYFAGADSSLKNSISGQIEKGFTESEQTYYSRLASQILDDISVNGFAASNANSDISQMTLEQFAEAMHGAEEYADLDEQYTKQQLDNIREVVSNTDEQILNILSGYDISTSFGSIEALSDMMSQQGGWFRNLLKIDNDKELSEAAEKLLQNMGESEDLQKDYNEFANKALEYAKANAANQNTFLDVRAMKIVAAQINISVSMSHEEMYQIPVEIGGELTSINLKFRHNTNETQKVSISMFTHAVGNIEGEFTVSDSKVRGIVVSDNANSVSLLSDSNESFANELQSKLGLTVENITYANNDNAYSNNIFNEVSTVGDNNTSSQELYRFAKIFIETVRASF